MTEPGRYRLVAIDLTGTLLEPDGGLDPDAVDLIGKCWDQGVRFVLATGLPPRTAATVARRLDVPAHLIAYSGAVTLAPPDREVVAAVPLDLEAAAAALRRARGRVEACALGYVERVVADRSEALGVPLDRWLLGSAAVEPAALAALAESPENATPADPEPGSVCGGVGAGNALLAVLLFGDEPVLGALAAELAAAPELRGRARAVRISRHVLEVVAAGVSKGEALARLLAELRTPREAVLAIGDSRADAELFAAAGLGCAVANADPELKRVAGYVAAEPTGRGVAEISGRFVWRKERLG